MSPATPVRQTPLDPRWASLELWKALVLTMYAGRKQLGGALVGFLLAVWFVNRLVGGEDAPIKYENPSPKVPDEERILEEPSIKVRPPLPSPRSLPPALPSLSL